MFAAAADDDDEDYDRDNDIVKWLWYMIAFRSTWQMCLLLSQNKRTSWKISLEIAAFRPKAELEEAF